MVTKNKKVNENGRYGLSKLTTIIVLTVFIIYALTFLASFLWLFLSSLKGQIEYAQDKVSLPSKWLFGNYIKAFTELEINGTGMFGMIGNTLWFAILQVSINIFFTVCFSYAITKYKFPGVKILSTSALVVLILPIMGALPAQYKMYNALNLLNSRLFVLTAIGGCIGYNFFIFSAVFGGLSNSYMEAAFIDGAGHFTVFFKVMLPQISGSIMALLITSFVTNWNDYMNPFLFYETLPTLATGLYVYGQSTLREFNEPVYFAGILLAMLPVLLLFFAFQDSMMKLSVGGGIKG